MNRELAERSAVRPKTSLDYNTVDTKGERMSCINVEGGVPYIAPLKMA